MREDFDAPDGYRYLQDPHLPCRVVCEKEMIAMGGCTCQHIVAMNLQDPEGIELSKEFIPMHQRKLRDRTMRAVMSHCKEKKIDFNTLWEKMLKSKRDRQVE